MNQIHCFVLFFNKFLFLFSSSLQTLHSKLKKKNFLQENDQKNKQTNKQKSYYKDNMHINMFTVLLVKPPSHPVDFSFLSKIAFMEEINKQINK